jgi:LmbE family N-acetylglucosaminyl deacetylase
MYYCIDDTFRTHISDYFIYFPPGYKKSEIDETIDVSSVWDKKVTALNKHESQKADIDTILPILQKLPKEEYFLVKKRNKNIK